MKDKFIVAVKDTKKEKGKILPGKILGSFRALEFAQRDCGKLAVRECGWGNTWHVGIFHNDVLVR